MGRGIERRRPDDTLPRSSPSLIALPLPLPLGPPLCDCLALLPHPRCILRVGSPIRVPLAESPAIRSRRARAARGSGWRGRIRIPPRFASPRLSRQRWHPFASEADTLYARDAGRERVGGCHTLGVGYRRLCVFVARGTRSRPKAQAEFYARAACLGSKLLSPCHGSGPGDAFTSTFSCCSANVPPETSSIILVGCYLRATRGLRGC